MSRLFMSKKGVTSKFLLVFGIFCIIFCIYSFTSGMTERGFLDSDIDAFIKILAPILTGMAGGICILTAVCYGKTSISVYDDHIEGTGVGKFALAPHNFYFSNNTNYTVQKSGGKLNISCGGESYAVMLTAADAQEVYNCIYGNSSTQNHQANQTNYKSSANSTSDSNATNKNATTPQTTIAICPHCGTKCRVPSGRGLIRITCPNAKCKVPFTFNS
ncbi:MAG: hypothetical protein IKM53_01110 [Clostridia bacterium]|nr:hypothetical protein [Clostridia bacterium]